MHLLQNFVVPVANTHTMIEIFRKCNKNLQYFSNHINFYSTSTPDISRHINKTYTISLSWAYELLELHFTQSVLSSGCSSLILASRICPTATLVISRAGTLTFSTFILLHIPSLDFSDLESLIRYFTAYQSCYLVTNYGAADIICMS